MCGQIGDCVTTAGRRPQALGFAACSVSVYIARTLGLRGGATAVNHMKKHQRYTAQFRGQINAEARCERACVRV